MIFKKRHKTAVVYLSTFPPRECGIATFTEDLVNAMDDFLSPKVDSKIVTMQSEAVTSGHPSPKVFFSINQNNKEEYKEAARKINDDKETAIVSIQHEFGIFGGAGSHYLSYYSSASQ